MWLGVGIPGCSPDFPPNNLSCLRRCSGPRFSLLYMEEVGGGVPKGPSCRDSRRPYWERADVSKSLQSPVPTGPQDRASPTLTGNPFDTRLRALAAAL